MKRSNMANGQTKKRTLSMTMGPQFDFQPDEPIRKSNSYHKMFWVPIWLQLTHWEKLKSSRGGWIWIARPRSGLVYGTKHLVCSGGNIWSFQTSAWWKNAQMGGLHRGRVGQGGGPTQLVWVNVSIGFFSWKLSFNLFFRHSRCCFFFKCLKI